MREKHGGAVQGPMEVRVWLRLLSCAMLIEKRIRRNFAEQFDMTLPRFDVMAALERHPQGQSMGELSRALLVSNGNVTAIVKALQQDGLVTLETDPSDRRASIVALSRKGRALFIRLARAHHAWIREALEDFPREKQEALHELLAALKHSID